MLTSNYYIITQAIWCALYKQTPGDEGWKVLGMINNYQQDAGEVDDRDSGSITILASLKKGDQVNFNPNSCSLILDKKKYAWLICKIL